MASSRGALRELDIGLDAREAELSLDGTATGAACAGCLVALAAGVSPQHGRDVLQSLLLAQLAANAKANRFKDPLTWYRTYQSTLESIGWVAFSDTSFTRYVPQLNRYSLTRVVEDTLRVRTSPDELDLLDDVLLAFTHDDGGPAQFVWECPSHSGGIGNFQIAVATEEENGTVTVQVGRYTFESPVHVTRLAREEFGRDAKFSSAYLAMTLNEQVFAGLRAAVEQKLENRYDALVAQIGLPSG